MDRYDTPGWEGSVGPFPDDYTKPHVYARDICSGAGNCVCGIGLPDEIHVQAAPGIDIPGRAIVVPSRYLGKSAEEQRYVLGVGYQPGPDPRIARGADGYRDYFTAEELEKAAWSFLKSGGQIGLFHEDGTLGHATPVESYVHRAPDWDQGNGIVIKTGTWLIGAICDDIAWQLVKSGRVTGFSPQGFAKRRRPSIPPNSTRELCRV